MIHEVLTEYGPVHRFWFDGTSDYQVRPCLPDPARSSPSGSFLLQGNRTELWEAVYDTIRTTSPSTLISAYRGDVCASTGSLYYNDGPASFSSDIRGCQPAKEDGRFFHPTEMHGITIQEGPDGNSDSIPTYWFWHPWCHHAPMMNE